MPSLTLFNRTFTPKWTITVLTLLILGLFIRLGLWQLHRAQEKRDMIHASQTQGKQTAQLWHPGMPNPKQYHPITLQGTYSPTTFYLDNQHQQHRWGYNVISPLILDNQSVVLIDRGWLLGDMDRRQVPAVTIPQGIQTIKGYAYYPSTKSLVLGPEFEEKSSLAIVIEKLAPANLEHFLQKTCYPFIIRLDPEQENGYVRAWPIVSMPPERHLGYAVQWFAMALILLILYVGLNLKKK